MRHLDAVVPRESYLRSGGLAGEIDQELVNRNGLREFFREPRERGAKSFAGSDALLKLIRTKRTAPLEFRRLEKLRGFEREVRNPAAHEIRAITSSFAQDAGGMGFSDVMGMLYNVNGVKSGLYDRINQRIMQSLEVPAGGGRS